MQSCSKPARLHPLSLSKSPAQVLLLLVLQVGEYSTENVGRTPNAAVAPTGQYYEEKDNAMQEADK